MDLKVSLEIAGVVLAVVLVLAILIWYARRETETVIDMEHAKMFYDAGTAQIEKARENLQNKSPSQPPTLVPSGVPISSIIPLYVNQFTLPQRTRSYQASK